MAPKVAAPVPQHLAGWGWATMFKARLGLLNAVLNFLTNRRPADAILSCKD